MSVVDKIGGLALSPAQEALRAQLTAADVALARGDAGARLEKARTLVELDRFAAVVHLLGDAEARSSAEETCLAYAQYRLGDLDALRAWVSSEAPLGARVALAQAEYRFGSLAAARERLGACLPELSAEDAADAHVNLAAVAALGGVVPRAVDTFEDCFNAACAYLARGDGARAQHSLARAAALAEEPEDALAVRAQQAVAALFVSKRDTAAAAELNALLPELAPAAQLVAANNVLAARHSDSSVEAAHAALRTFDALPRVRAELNASQTQIIERNLLKLLARAGVHTLRRARRHAERFPTDLEPLVLAYHYSQPRTVVRQQLARGDRAARLLADAAAGARRATLDTALVPGSLDMAYAAALRATRGEADGVREYFESLTDARLREAGLCVLGGEHTAEQLLTAVDGLIGDFDVTAELERALDAKPVSTSRVHKKKTNKRRLPASFDAAKQPDPERWLAKQDRSGAKKKRAGATQGAAQGAMQGATQGGVPESVVESNIPASKTASKPKKKTKKKGRR